MGYSRRVTRARQAHVRKLEPAGTERRAAGQRMCVSRAPVDDIKVKGRLRLGRDRTVARRGGGVLALERASPIYDATAGP